MILDAYHLMSDAQALTATAASTNLIDLGADRNIGQGENMSIVILLDVAADFTSANETYSAAIQTDDNSGFSSATTVGTLTITGGDAAGTRYIFTLPPTTSMERYLRINYTLAGTTPTVTLTAFLIPTDGIDKQVVYPNGYTIS